MKANSNPYYIYNKLFGMEDFVAITGFLAFVLVFVFTPAGIYFTPVLLLIAYYLYRLSLRVQHREVQIRINEKGIIDREGRIYPWHKIEHAYVSHLNKATSQSSTSYALFIHLTDGKVTLILEGLAYQKERIKEAVEYFSQRDIGDEADKLRDDIRKIIGDEIDTGEVIRVFKKFTGITTFISLLIFFGLMATGIYFQVTKLYWFAIGLSFEAVILVFWGMVHLCWRLLSERPLLSDLSLHQIQKVAALFGMSFGSSSPKRFVTVSTLVAAGIVAANYFIQQST